MWFIYAFPATKLELLWLKTRSKKKGINDAILCFLLVKIIYKYTLEQGIIGTYRVSFNFCVMFIMSQLINWGK